jgi:hypothetical protein
MARTRTQAMCRVFHATRSPGCRQYVEELEKINNSILNRILSLAVTLELP